MQGNKSDKHSNQNSTRYRVCHRHCAAFVIRRRCHDPNNDERRDDGEQRDGWIELDVDSHFTYSRSWCVAWLDHLRSEEVIE